MLSVKEHVYPDAKHLNEPIEMPLEEPLSHWGDATLLDWITGDGKGAGTKLSARPRFSEGRNSGRLLSNRRWRRSSRHGGRRCTERGALESTRETETSQDTCTTIVGGGGNVDGPCASTTSKRTILRPRPTTGMRTHAEETNVGRPIVLFIDGGAVGGRLGEWVTVTSG